MASLKPQLIRADTLDLQSPDSPSAKDHSRQPPNASLPTQNSTSSHQIQTLRSVEQHALQDKRNGPDISHDRGGGKFIAEPEFYDDPEDGDDDNDSSEAPLFHDRGHAAMQSADDVGVDDGNIGDHADDEGLDDDMMDRISSSPSIDDDGKYPSPVVWPFSRASTKPGAVPLPTPFPNDNDDEEEALSSSSPYVSTPEHYPMRVSPQEVGTPCRHRNGKYAGYTLTSLAGSSPWSIESPSHEILARFRETEHERDNSAHGLEMDDINHLLVPLDDPLLSADDESEADGGALESAADDSEWEDGDDSEAENADLSLDDDAGNFFLTTDTAFIAYGWSGACLREIEDIDFEFVYALHTFVATVEGQANATKGDTMVLLDDSNSYWWLIRVVKDGSIGYLPAEHVETPTERLARLNKRRNIDLSATMLSDNAEKSKNPLKKAMRRRNAKTVQFAPPQYFEPSDNEYSDEEEGMDEDFEKMYRPLGATDQDGMEAEEENRDGGSASDMKDNNVQGQPVNGTQHLNHSEDPYGGTLRQSDGSRSSDELSTEDQQEGVAERSSRGLVRNTDSFFKDDGRETKKISLTPRLLQGDSDFASGSQEPEPKPKSSVDSFDKVVSPEPDRSGDEKKKKEKKGMLGGFFKRKDKKGRLADSEMEDSKKVSGDVSRATPPSKKSPESTPQEARPTKGDRVFQRQSSKLQKQPPPHISPKSSPSKDNLPKSEQDSVVSPSSQASSSAPSTLQSPTPESSKVSEEISRSRSSDNISERPASPSGRRTIFTSMTDALKPGPSRQQQNGLEVRTGPAPAEATRNRGESLDTRSEEDYALSRRRSESRSDEPSREPSQKRSTGPREGSKEGPRAQSRESSQERLREQSQVGSRERSREGSREGSRGQSRERSREPSQEGPRVRPTPPMLAPPSSRQLEERASQSSMEVSPMEPWEGTQKSSSESQPPTLMVDNSSNSERRSVSPISLTSSSSASAVDADVESPNETDAPTNPTATSPHGDAPTPSTTRSTPTWSDASLRTYMDNDEDIRDLLIIIHDKSNVVPAGPEHPITGNLFGAEKGRLADMQANLESMLTNWLARKNQAMLSR